MQTNTTRRALIAALPAVAVVAAAPAIAFDAEPRDRTAVNAAMAALRHIETDDAAFTPGWNAAGSKCAAECDAVPHVTLPARPGYSPLTTSDHWHVRQARRDVEALDAGKMHLDDIAN